MAKVGRPKGQPKTGGRVKGSKTKRTERLKDALSEIVIENVPRLREEIAKLEGKDYLWAVEKFTAYVIPKPVATDVKMEADVKTTASVQYKKDMEVLDNIPADVIADIAEKLQMSMANTTTTLDVDSVVGNYDDDGED